MERRCLVDASRLDPLKFSRDNNFTGFSPAEPALAPGSALDTRRLVFPALATREGSFLC